MAEEQNINLGSYHIVIKGDKLKIMILDHKCGIAALPSSGNTIVLMPVPAGANQLEKQ